LDIDWSKISQAKANDWIKRLAALEPLMLDSMVPVGERIAAGEVPLGIAYPKYVQVWGRKGAPLDYVKGLPVYLGDGNYIAMTAKAPNPNASKLFAEWLISDEGQKTIDTGPYAIVRHPMYASALALFIGAPLLLGSYLGLFGSVILILGIAWRARLTSIATPAGLALVVFAGGWVAFKVYVVPYFLVFPVATIRGTVERNTSRVWH
jgi:hypothetical protein